MAKRVKRVEPDNRMTAGCVEREYCATHHVHHYRCAECGHDCTMGTAKGPPTTAVDKVTRCYECHRTFNDRMASASPYGYEEVSTLIEALRALVRERDDGDGGFKYDEHRERALLWLERMGAL